jgi:hypothetical protein
VRTLGVFMSRKLDLALSPKSERYDADDPRWREQVAELVKDLRVETDALRVAHTGVPGTKGAVDEFILTLASAGVFSTALDVLRAWLARDKTRSVELSYEDAAGKDQHVSVTATNADVQTLEPVLVAMAARIAAEP